MPARRVEPERGWSWIVYGWRLFVKSPGPWIGMILIYFIISMVLSFIPLFGALASTLITPALMGGMIYGAAALDQGRHLEIAHLFRAFQDQKRLGPMLTLGVLLLAAYLVVGLLVAGLMTGGMMGPHPVVETQEMMGPPGGTAMMPRLGVFGLLILLLMGLAIAMAMFYAIPLVMLNNRPPVQAIRDSVSACLSNILPLLVFMLVYVVLAFIAAIPFGLGFLVLGPVTFAAIYASYRDVFGEGAQRSLAAPPT